MPTAHLWGVDNIHARHDPTVEDYGLVLRRYDPVLELALFLLLTCCGLTSLLHVLCHRHFQHHRTGHATVAGVSIVSRLNGEDKVHDEFCQPDATGYLGLPPGVVPMFKFKFRERPLPPDEVRAETRRWLANGLDDVDGPEQLAAFMF